ncbi:MAG: hydrogenase maturation nickel metallochaperone HypA [Anaerolineaceae bacterium]
MHELSITENILQIALKHAEQAHAARVTDINLVIGSLSSVIDDSVQFYWDFLSENTICHKAGLHFDRRPAVLKCRSCANEYKIEGSLEACPACQGENIQIISGEEFFLDSIEIEK